MALPLAEWQQIQLGLASQSYAIVSLYDTLGPSAVHFCLQHSEISIAFVSATHLPALLELCGDKTPTLKTVVCVDLWAGGPGGMGAKGLKEVARAWGREKGVNVLDLAERESPCPAHRQEAELTSVCPSPRLLFE